MWMSSKFIRSVLALVCSAALVSSSMGLSGPGGGGSGKNGGSGSGSGSGGGSGSGSGNSGRNGGGSSNNSGGNGGENESEANDQGAAQSGGAQGIERKLASLKSVPVPGPTAAEINDLVRSKAAAIALGKALFWDMQSGSDGFTACATCHFNAGADSRSMNQIDPGLRRVDSNGNAAADSTLFFPGFGPNHQLSMSDFPLHKLSDPTNSNSAVMSDNNNIVGSQGQFLNTFNDVVMGLGPETVTPVDDPVWHISDSNGAPMNVRRSTPRNAPPVINAVFNYRNFWDGRAQSIFNGVDPFGDGDPNATILQTDATDANVVHNVHLRLSNSSLASQSVGPPGSDVEMSATGRPFIKIGKKMLSVTPLVLQQVSPSDSVLGSYSDYPFTGLNTDYATMVQAAFQPKWWNSNVVVDKDSNILHLG